MKGIVLAGGIGSRLSPLTRVTNKHLLPVYDKPMIFYPLQILVDAGIRDILIVTGGHNAGDFLRLLQNGKEFGLGQLSFAYQEGEAGIADALRLAEPWARGDKICVVLGDNIIEGDIKDAATKFEELEQGRDGDAESRLKIPSASACRSSRTGASSASKRSRRSRSRPTP